MSSVGRVLNYVLLIAVTLVLLFPLLYAISGSMMTAQELATFPPALLPAHPQLQSFADVLRAIPLTREYLNSALVAGVCTLGQLATATLSAFAFVTSSAG